MPRKAARVDRDALLDAAETLAGQVAPAQLSSGRICAAAGCTPGAFRAHFGGPAEYLLAVQQRFMDSIRDRIVVLGTRSPGYDRVLEAGVAYLDASLERQALRAWLAAARARHPELADAVQRHNEVYKLLLAGDFRRLGWSQPAAAAALFFAMLMETGERERQAGRALPEMRDTLREFVRV